MDLRDLCDEIDGLMTLDVGFRGVARGLYPAARLHANKPLSLAAAEMLMNASRVLLVTGFKVLPRIVQETDGPPGALILAKTLVDLGVEVSIAIEEDSTRILKAGLEVLDIDCEVLPLPINVDLTDYSRELLNKKPVSSLVFIEKAGSNEVGVYHNMRGSDVTQYHAKAEALLHEAKRRGLNVMAVGDGGNEVGFGLIKKAVELYVPKGRRCGCPCGGGIASSSKADLVIVASTSNIGCYAISCALSMLNGAPWPHSREVEVELIKALIDAGAVDGMTCRSEMMVDGVPINITASIVELLRHISDEARKH
ncbi:MAG: DUF4392 domain-containing protein [Candidatus Nezhaarchaeota archaeon]|nr:DUF4392 domain-containing protein [Candidatus Nezhaarchaeota archaeon]MCX8142215.1 DUF4392 domain-containing protein [Candidatus Nezhaarchaeota archaeon]MDW8050812.1 DUF4392 domain-containing protein [Nitrososphaerota archaeon]